MPLYSYLSAVGEKYGRIFPTRVGGSLGRAFARPRPFTRTHYRESEKSKTPFQPILAGIGGADSMLTMNSHDSCSVAKSS